PALVLLERRDLLRVGGPEEDRAVTVGPSGVVGGVAEVLDPVGGELGLLPRRQIADPQVVTANEGRQLPVGRGHRARPRGVFLCRGSRAFVGCEIAGPVTGYGAEGDRLPVGGELELRERKVKRLVRRTRGQRASGR